ncbi:MAG: redox-regulated ATPase YchF [Bdellovibrionota bacterium]
MPLNCGIVGLPNVGKSTIFQAITSAPAEAANYPFCTIEPNVGIVAVADERLDRLVKIFEPQKVIPAVVEFVDIAGLVKGASKGEGLGNQFLGHIRNVNAIVHVVRCFEDSNIIHVTGKVDPLDDIETINIELALADLEVVEKRLPNLPKLLKSQNKEAINKAKIQAPILEKLLQSLAQGIPARKANLSAEDEQAIKDLNLITLKKMLYLCNVDESNINVDNDHIKKVREYALKNDEEVFKICGKLEAEVANFASPEERKQFLTEMGLETTGLAQLTTIAYRMLGLRTYFTVGEKEVRAWTFEQGMKAPETAGIIHTDFQKGFIRAEVYHCEDIFKFGTEVKVKEAGKFRLEGKEYLVHDGDIMHFRFNV